MELIVQKFGGTSVKDNNIRRAAAQKVIEAKKKGKMPVVIVSAIGRKGAPYATDTLINMAKDIFKDTHLRELDLIMSCGEIISSVIMANTLEALGCNSVALTGMQAGVITDESFSSARVLKVDPQKILKLVEEDKVPVIAGFQGATIDGEITTIGRGGSDTSAVLIGEAIAAEYVEIYTDVNGIMTADPRIVENASVLKEISYNEVFQMADKGAKVIHPRAVEVAARANLPLIIKNPNTNSQGTRISSGYISDEAEKNITSIPVVTNIAHINGRTQVSIHDLTSKIEENLLKDFADSKISIDLINIFPDKMIFTIDDKNKETAQQILSKYKADYNMITNCSKVSAIGSGMRGVPGVMMRIINALIENGIDVLQTADSHMTISCLVKEEDTVKAVLSLHDEFELYNLK